MTDPVEGKTLGQDENPHANVTAKDAIQEIVWDLMRHIGGQGRDPEEVEGLLSAAIIDAGLPEQPAPWVQATAIEIAGGREVVMDVKDQVEPERIEVEDGEVTLLAKPTGLPDKPGGPRPSAQERSAE